MVRRMVCGLGVGDGVTDWLIESFYEKVSPALDDDFFFGLKTDFF